jgi:hypothetical protein
MKDINDIETLYKSLTFKKFSWKEPSFSKDWDAYDKAMKGKPKLKTGNVLLMKDGKYLLVGDVNKFLGVCDDCTDYSLEDIRKIATLPGFENYKYS